MAKRKAAKGTEVEFQAAKAKEEAARCAETMEMRFKLG